MKWKRMTHTCIDKDCGYTETDHKAPDARKCPKCNMPVFSKYVKAE